MKRIVRMFVVAASVGLAAVLVAPEVDAKRMGGGRSIGQQSTLPAQRSAAPQRPAQAQQPAAANAAAGQAAAPRNRWLAPIAGLAAGLGLAALASHLGLGEQFANLIMIALLAFVAFAVFRYFAARRMRGAEPALAGAGAGMARSSLPGGASWPTGAATGGTGAMPAPAGAESSETHEGIAGVPAGFDVDGFLRTAKVHFVRLQAAYDAADLSDLREFTTPEMFAELKVEIGERAGQTNRTDVVTLEAELLGIESRDGRYVASVRFGGMLREGDGAAAQPFAEAWNLVKPMQGEGGWLLAGIQQIH